MPSGRRRASAPRCARSVAGLLAAAPDRPLAVTVAVAMGSAAATGPDRSSPAAARRPGDDGPRPRRRRSPPRPSPGGEPEPTDPAPETDRAAAETTPTDAGDHRRRSPAGAEPPADRAGRHHPPAQPTPEPRRRRSRPRSDDPRRPASPAPRCPASARLGAHVTTSDITLGRAYWNAAARAATLRVTVANTGSTANGSLSLHAARRA